MTEETFRELPNTASYLAKLSKSQEDQLYLIIVRLYQANRHQSFLDWHALTEFLLILARTASRDAWTPDAMAFADDLFTLAGLCHERSTELIPANLTRLPYLMSEAA